MEKRLMVSRLAAAALLVLTALLRCGNLPFFSSFGGALLLLPMLIALAMFDTPVACAVYGLFAGALWDFSSPLPDGLLTLFCTLCAPAVSLCVRFFLRRRLSAALAAGCVVFLLCALLLTLAGVSQIGERQRLFAGYYLPAMAAALLILPLDFWIMKKLFHDPREDRVI